MTLHRELEQELPTLDTLGLISLVQDRRWGNESLFALLQGLRRLAETGEPARLALPGVEVTAP